MFGVFFPFSRNSSLSDLIATPNRCMLIRFGVPLTRDTQTWGRAVLQHCPASFFQAGAPPPADSRQMKRPGHARPVNSPGGSGDASSSRRSTYSSRAIARYDTSIEASGGSHSAHCASLLSPITATSSGTRTPAFSARRARRTHAGRCRRESHRNAAPPPASAAPPTRRRTCSADKSGKARR